MDKPASKAELLTAIKAERKQLEKSLKGLSPIDMVKTAAPDEWSIQDILAHITAWENKLTGWYQRGILGEKPDVPDWSQPGIIDKINLDIYKLNHDRWIKEVRKEFKESHKQILKTVKSMPEEDIFIAGRVDWTGKATLLDYIWGNTGGHYAEHIPMIEAIRQKLGI